MSNINDIIIDEEINEDDEKIKKCTSNHILYTDSEDLEEWIPHNYWYDGREYYKNISDYLKRTSRKKEDNTKSMTIWCNDCSKVYHAVCESGRNQLVKLYNIKFTEDIELYNKLGSNCNLYLNKVDNYRLDELKKKIEEIGAYKGVLHKCSKYRENHHKNCYKNINGKYEGDPGHKDFIQILNDTFKICNTAETTINAKINKLEKEYKKSDKKIVRSLDRKATKDTATKIRSKYSDDKKHHKVDKKDKHKKS